MSISVIFDDEQSARLEARARDLGVDARELAKAAVNDLLNAPRRRFRLRREVRFGKESRALSAAELMRYNEGLNQRQIR